MILSFFKNSFIYSATGLIIKLGWLFSLPIMTRYLPVRSMGIFEMVLLMVGLVVPFISWRVNIALLRFYPYKGSFRSKQKMISTILSFNLISISIFIGLGLLLINFEFILLESLMNLSLVKIAMVYAALQILIEFFFMVLRVNDRLDLYFKANLFTVVTIIIASLSLIYWENSIISFLQILVAGHLMVILFVALKCRKYIILYLNRIILSKLLKFSYPIIFSGLLTTLSTWIDRIMIPNYLNLESLGIYSVSYRIATVILLIITAFQLSINTIIFQNYGEKDSPKNMVIITGLALSICLFFLLFLGLFSEEFLFRFIGQSYDDSIQYIFFIALSVIFSSGLFLFPGIHIAKKTKMLILITLAVLSIKFLLNVLLLPVLNLWGAVITSLIGGILMILLVGYFSQKLYYIPYNFLKFISLIVFVIVLNYIGQILPYEGFVEHLIKLLFIAIFILSTFALGFVKVEYFYQFKNLIYKKFVSK